jgi:hypothetical protein
LELFASDEKPRAIRLNCIFKKVENLAIALIASYYDFVRIHETLRVTPAIAAGVTDRLSEIGDLVQVLEDWESQQRQAAKSPFSGNLLLMVVLIWINSPLSGAGGLPS